MSHFVFHPKSFIVKPHICPHISIISRLLFRQNNFFYRDCWLYWKKMYGTLSNTISFVCHTLLLSVTQFSISHMILLSVTQFYHLSHNSTICHIILLSVIWFCYLSNNSTICHTIIPSVTWFYYLSHNSTICHTIILSVT